MATATAAALLHPPVMNRALKWKRSDATMLFPLPSLLPSRSRRGVVRTRAFCNPLENPILKEALKEPVAFLGGMFAGLLRLNLNEEPLKEWIVRTAEAAGITEEIGTASETVEDAPKQIEIE